MVCFVRVLMNCVVLKQIESKFEAYIATLPSAEQQKAQEMFKAYRYILSSKMTKSMSERNLLSSFRFFTGVI